MDEHRIGKRLLRRLGLGTALLGVALGVSPSAEAFQSRKHKLAALAPSPAAPSCFEHQGTVAEARRMESSTVILVSRSAVGQPLSQGSGAIIADSAVEPGGHNRILTDAHMLNIKQHALETVQEAKDVMVIAPTGRVLGWAVAVAMGTHDISRSFQHDQAVLEMTTFKVDGAAAFDAIPGFRLGDQDSSGFIRGLISDPSGPEPGASGGPVLDRTGKLLGLTQSVTVSGIKLVTYPQLYDSDGKGLTGDPVTPVSFFAAEAADTYAGTIIDIRILHALGAAGGGVVPGHVPSQPVVIAGAPHGYCVVYSGEMEGMQGNDLDSFRIPKPARSIQGSVFTAWHDQALSMSYVKELLETLHQSRPETPKLDLWRADLKDRQTLKDVATETFSNALETFSLQAQDPDLGRRLSEASSEVSDLAVAVTLQMFYVQPPAELTGALGSRPGETPYRGPAR